MDACQFEQLVALLTEIRDDQRAFVALMQEPAPALPHVHAPADGEPPGRFWVCQCGFIFDDEAVNG